MEDKINDAATDSLSKAISQAVLVIEHYKGLRDSAKTKPKKDLYARKLKKLRNNLADAMIYAEIANAMKDRNEARLAEELKKAVPILDLNTNNPVIIE